MESNLIAVYIIKSPNRSNKINTNLFTNSNKIQFEIKEIAAIYPQIDNKFCNYSRKFYKTYKRDALIGEYGCLLSHFSIWVDIKNNKNVISIVLEDDAEIEPCKNLEYLVEFMSLQDHPTIVRLGKSKVTKEGVQLLNNQKPGSVIARNGCIKIIREWFLNTDGTVGYILNYSAAKALSKQMHLNDGRLVDDWKYTKKIGICVYQLKPFLVYENAVASTICTINDIRYGVNNRTRGYWKCCLTIISRAINYLRGFGFTN